MLMLEIPKLQIEGYDVARQGELREPALLAQDLAR